MDEQEKRGGGAGNVGAQVEGGDAPGRGEEAEATQW